MSNPGNLNACSPVWFSGGQGLQVMNIFTLFVMEISPPTSYCSFSDGHGPAQDMLLDHGNMKVATVSMDTSGCASVMDKWQHSPRPQQEVPAASKAKIQSVVTLLGFTPSLDNASSPCLSSSITGVEGSLGQASPFSDCQGCLWYCGEC